MGQGFVCLPDESNDEYLATFREDDAWRPVILDAHAKLLAIDPDYRIAQIKEKFGGLRYYYDSSSPNHEAMDKVIQEAEAAIDAIEAAR